MPDLVNDLVRRAPQIEWKCELLGGTKEEQRQEGRGGELAY